MDNVAFHKTTEVKTYLQSKKCNLLFIPPYSPEFNPIELAFSKIKNAYRKLCIQDNFNREEGIKVAINTLTAFDLQHYYDKTNEFVNKIGT